MEIVTYSDPPYKSVLQPGIGGLKSVPHGYWDNIHNIRDNLEWSIEREGMNFDDDLPRKISVPFLKKAGLGRLLAHYNNSPFKVMDTAYSGRYHVWQFKHNGNRIWTNEDRTLNYELARQATRWLIEEKLDLNAMTSTKATQKDFGRYGLSGMLYLFNGSVYGAVNNAYPTRFNEWEIRQKDMWQGEKGKELGKKAVRWLVDYLGIPIQDVPKKLSRRHFKENGLGGCLQKCFAASIYNAISETFPEIPREELEWMQSKVKHFRS